MHKGGRLVDQEDTACVFDTLPPCTKRARTLKTGQYTKNRSVARGQTRRLVRVVRRDDPTVPVQLRISKNLRKIPEYGDYFVVIDEFCEGAVSDDPDWPDCRLFAANRKRMPTFVQLRMLNGGVKLSDYVRNINATLEIWLELQIHLFEAVRLLHERHIVHGDLHTGNILVDAKGVPRIIDFGLSYNLDQLGAVPSIALTFLPGYDNYPPELDLLAGLVKGFSKPETIEMIYTEKRILSEIEELFPSRYTVIQDLTNFAQRFAIENGSDVKCYIQTYGRATDIWTLGYNFLRIYMIMIATPVVVSSPFYKRHHREQMRLLAGLLNVDPRRRLTADEALTQLYSMRMG